MLDFEDDEGWDEYQVVLDTICVACDSPAVVNDLGLCRRCNAKLDRDMIRDRDWERSEIAFLTPDDKREDLREQVIWKYGAAFELIEPPGKSRKNRQKKRKDPTPPPRPKSVQPPLPDEPLVDYTEQDVIVAIEAVIRTTTKAYGWRHLGDIGDYLHQAFADFQPSCCGCKNLLQFIEKHPERFKVKWSAPSKKGASHVWVRLSTEPKRKEGYTIP
ncbi:MAG: OST-HTH/LOTUS domain-containing protein [Anaerolineae bacterium]|nr:OST-HTH/LOTUS domain-containing protein [Anaerolineae bacterium]